MNQKKKPSWFSVTDLLFIAIPGVLILALDLALQFVKVDAKPGWQWLMLLVGLTFLGVWWRIAGGKRKYFSEFRWYPTYGVFAHGNGYSLPDDLTMDAAVRETVNRWALHFGPRAQAALDGDVVWVFFKKDLDENANNRAKAKVQGYTVAFSHIINVDFDVPDQPLAGTAFDHELGHMIYGFSTGDWEQQSEHDYIRKNGLR